jgi:phosphoribosylanthranilate isomerase
MRRTRIKICGLCRPQDARLAADAGADAVGLVFCPASPRNVSIEQAREILAQVPPFVTPVGLFVDAPVDQILATAQTLGLGCIQLHGQESPTTVAALKPLTILKALPVERATFPAVLQSWKQSIAAGHLENLKGLLLETASVKPGGSGIPNDWETIASTQSAGLFNDLPPIIAAGGLTPGTVAQVVRTLRPWAVDVSSGVEEAMRQKSPKKIADFIAAVRQTDGE